MNQATLDILQGIRSWTQGVQQTGNLNGAFVHAEKLDSNHSIPPNWRKALIICLHQGRPDDAIELCHRLERCARHVTAKPEINQAEVDHKPSAVDQLLKILKQHEADVNAILERLARAN